MENFMKRLLCVVLSMSILIPGLNLESISASAETVTSRFELEPVPNGSSISDNDAQNEMISEVLDEPDVNVKSNKKKNNWWLLYHYDHLAYGEIHWRVQNDILYNQQKSITGLELHINYIDVPDEDFQSNRAGTYGRVDVYKDAPNGITYLWEVNPPSYRDKNKSKGLDQINRYVNNGYGNFDYGSNSLGSVNESEFQFHLPLTGK